MDRGTQGTLISSFEARVRESPRRVAVVDGLITWTFEELSQRANQIAARMCAEGVAPAAYIGLHLPPSADLVASLLAILKVGAAYVPIDRSAPIERVRFILQDSRSSLVITDRNDIQEARALHVENLRSGADALDTFVWPDVPPDSDAYVIYTSGSTGKPKGVICTHRNVLRLFSSTQGRFSFSASDRWILFHSIAFDFSVWEVFGALLYGGTLVIVNPDVARDTLAFARLLIDQRITVLNQTPSAFYNLVMAAQSRSVDCFPGLRCVVLGGERVQCAKLAHWFDIPNDRRPTLINMYGITETTVHVTYRELTSADVDAHPNASPIGAPIDDLSVYLLGADLKPVPNGDVGEICVAGPGVSRGYLNRLEATVERFIHNPFDRGSSPILYRSGDLGCVQCGELFYVGRSDRQVKIRGYRIELGEIESALLTEKGVGASHVMALDPGTPDARLIAHIIPDEKVFPGAYAEADFLRRRPDGVLRLDSGLQVAYLNRAETVFMFKEIFEDRMYEALGVVFRDDACVVDVGANIGIFSLFVMTRCRNPRLLAIEPIPACAEVLELNLKRFGANASVYRLALSHDVGTAQFRHFHQATVMSGRYAGADEAAAMTAYLRNKYGESGLAEKLGEGGIDQLVRENLEYFDIICQIDTLSNLIDRERIDHIDVLKVDVEKSEADVLRGIRQEHWPIIDQIVMEVHDVDDRLGRIMNQLHENGYTCRVNRDELLRGTSLCNLYAWREDSQSLNARVTGTPSRLTSERDELIRRARDSLTRKVPSYMMPSEMHVLSELPLTINGKVDERKLAARDPRALSGASQSGADHIERQVKEIWMEVLKLKEITVDVSLEHVGAHSLAAVMISLRLYKAFGVEVSPKELRGSASISSIAELIRTAKSRNEGATRSSSD